MRLGKSKTKHTFKSLGDSVHCSTSPSHVAVAASKSGAATPVANTRADCALTTSTVSSRASLAPPAEMVASSSALPQPPSTRYFSSAWDPTLCLPS